MNKEIKFRAWDRFRKKIVANILTIKIHRDTENPCLIVYTDKKINLYQEIKESDKIYCNEFELLQYTGLKDKNGKEIFEGDIIEKTYYSYHQPECSEIFKIIYNGLGFSFEHIKGRSYHTPFTEEIEVIGNIYENPELLVVENE